MQPLYLTLAAIVALLIAACWVALQIYRVWGSVNRARRNMADAKRSNRHQSEIRMFVEAQSKITRIDIQMGVMFGIWLVGLLTIAGNLLLGLRQHP